MATPEALPKREPIEGSPVWEKYSAMVERLEQNVDGLIEGYTFERENDIDKFERTQQLHQWEQEATRLKKDLESTKMPMLPEQVESIIKKIRGTLDQKLH